LSSIVLSSFGARAETLSQTRDWKKLLHWESDLLGFKSSQADGQDFFLAKDGSKNLESELQATLEALRRDDDTRCRFPARWLFLKAHYPELDSADYLDRCEKFREFRDGLAARSATLIFSSYYLNAPASAFGHTFLRLNKAGHDVPDSQKRELLDAGINYGAVQTTDNPLIYPFFGLAGLFRGEYARLPYYFKVREYGDFESRDLWGYDLELSQEEVDRLVAHVWELGHTYFAYYYLTENCSYHMLTLLEAAAPRLRLTDRMPAWTIPSETIRVLHAEPGLVRQVNYRPSMRSVFQSRAEGLDRGERAWVERLAVENPAPALQDFQQSLIARTAQIRILEAAGDLIDYRHPSKTVTGEDRGAWSDAKLKLLGARAKLGLGDLHKVPVPLDEQPHLGHPSRRWGLRYVDSKTVGADFRFALRDRFDPLWGYPQGSTLELLKFSTSYATEPKDFRLDEFTVFSASTLNTFTYFDKKASWRAKLTTRRESLWDCGDCRPFGLELGIGTHHLLSKDAGLRFTFLAETDLMLSGSFRYNSAAFVGPYVEVSRKTYDPFGFALFYTGRWQLMKDLPYKDRYGVKIFWDLGRRFQLHGEFKREGSARLWDVGFHHYF
jgi:hypothetical protein